MSLLSMGGLVYGSKVFVVNGIKLHVGGRVIASKGPFICFISAIPYLVYIYNHGHK